MAETIRVRAKQPFTKRVLLYEQSEEHPNGEIVLVSKNRKPVEVAPTAAVMALLERGSIEKVSGGGTGGGGSADLQVSDEAKAAAEGHGKDDLVALAEANNVEVARNDRKDVIAQKLMNAGVAIPAPEA